MNKMIEQEMRKISSPKKAKIYQRFFKTGHGQYGEGDLFLGVTVPQIRQVAKKFSVISFSENEKLLRSKWHELRLLALIIWTMQYQKSEFKNQKKIFKLYLKNKKWINNWDLVDVTVPQVIGHFIYHHGCRDRVFDLAKSRRLWDRRIAVLSTFYFIRQNQFSECLTLCEGLLADEEDLMHKACGWMLREVGKRDKKVLRSFIKRCSKKMPRTMLRYAIEKFNEKERKKILIESK